MKKLAILSVYDKTSLIDLARGLITLEWQLVASGGTARRLREAGLVVTDVETLTGSPEMLGGRVKTLHPVIHGGILAQATAVDQADLTVQNINPIHLVVCNLYPFQETIAQPDVTLATAVEQIDIGGVTLLRAAAKNHARVTVLCDPADYTSTLTELQQGQTLPTTRLRLAVKAFAHTRDYDIAITRFLQLISEEIEDC